MFNIEQRLQNKLTSLRKYFKNENINFNNLKILNNQIISFSLEDQFVDKFIDILEDKESEIL